MALQSAFQISNEPERYMGKEVSTSWDQRGTLVAVEQINPYGPSKVRLTIEEQYTGRVFAVELDQNQAVTVQD